MQIVERNYVLGIECSKIGAKTTINFQPMCLGKFLKCVKSKTRSTSVERKEVPIRKVTILGVDELQREGRLILTRMKKIAITD